MQDRAVVEAVVAGDPIGIAEAYDRYAASLYAYCRSMLAEPEAGEALLDTFIVAAARLDGLADPGRLEAWLRVVARNECLRLLGAGETGIPVAARSAVPGFADLDDELPAVTLPVELRPTVLAACADNSPAGRARRMSAAHRAGPFGPTGFPKAAGPPWWRRVRRHPRVAAAAVLAAVALLAGITVIMTAGGAHRPQASTLALGGGPAAGSTPGATPGSTSAAPSHQASPARSVTRAPSADPSTRRAAPTPPIRPSPSPRSPSPSPSPSPSASHSSLVVAPHKLVLTSKRGKPVSGLVTLTATGGPVSAYTIKVPAAKAGRVVVSPAKGSLRAGGSVVVTVTVTSKTGLNAVLTVTPGNLTVQVRYKVRVAAG
jgi:DNA-directed RNA polymerase specialized sigma24 family protein